MKCEECGKLGKTSTIGIGSSIVTSAGISQYYDEEGNYHHHDPNVSSTDYHCSNGHSWVVKSKHTCESCRRGTCLN